MNNIISTTELSYKSKKQIDELSDSEALKRMLYDQKIGINSLNPILPKILEVVSKVYYQLKKNSKSRLIYCGAGSSGRIAVQDGVELYPTFGWPLDRVQFIIAGGNEALIRSIENAEDDLLQAKRSVSKISINNKDVVIGLAASGNTPFTCKVIEEATTVGAITIGISNNPKGKILKKSIFKIILDTQQEVVAGSTRMKAGTVQKICLNLISTLLMIKLGCVKKGLMSNLVPTNKKLKLRKIMIEKYL